MSTSSAAWEARIARGRHVRLGFNLALCLTFSLFGYFYLGIDRSSTMAYAVVSFVLLVALNGRVLLTRIELPPARRKSE